MRLDTAPPFSVLSGSLYIVRSEKGNPYIKKTDSKKFYYLKSISEQLEDFLTYEEFFEQTNSELKIFKKNLEIFSKIPEKLIGEKNVRALSVIYLYFKDYPHITQRKNYEEKDILNFSLEKEIRSICKKYMKRAFLTSFEVFFDFHIFALFNEKRIARYLNIPRKEAAKLLGQNGFALSLSFGIEEVF